MLLPPVPTFIAITASSHFNGGQTNDYFKKSTIRGLNKIPPGVLKGGQDEFSLSVFGRDESQ